MRRDWAQAEEGVLVLAAKARNQHAFAEWMRRAQGPIRGLLRRLTANEAEADELAQEAFLRAWERLPDLKETAAARGWLRRIAVTMFLMSRRRKGRDLASLDEAMEVQGDEPAPDLAAGARLDLNRAMAFLSEPQRVCVTLCYGEGLSHQEVSALTGWPLGTVKSHANRGGAVLRKLLAHEIIKSEA